MAVVQAPMPGDWLYDPSAPQAARGRALAGIVSAELKRPVNLVRRRLPRGVIVATGEPKLELPPGQEAVQISAGPWDPKRVNSTTRGQARGILGQLAQVAEERVVDQTKPGPAWNRQVDILSRFEPALSRQKPGPARDGLIDQMLKNLAPQTGLTFRREVRQVDVWVLE